MRQKKSNLPYYIIAAVILIAAGFVILHEIPVSVKHVEEVVR